MLRLAIAAAALLLPLAMANAGAAEEGGPKIDRAWARATPGAAKTGAAYFRIRSPADDRLLGLASPVADKAELHTHVEAHGLMQMHAVEGGVAVQAAQTLELRPGGPFHVMLINLKRPLKAGESFPLTLIFEKAGSREVVVTVERLGAMGPPDDAPMSHDAMHHGAMRHDGGYPSGSARP
jgi:periplasmic copper chaperone A